MKRIALSTSSLTELIVVLKNANMRYVHTLQMCTLELYLQNMYQIEIATIASLMILVRKEHIQ